MSGSLRVLGTVTLGVLRPAFRSSPGPHPVLLLVRSGFLPKPSLGSRHRKILGKRLPVPGPSSLTAFILCMSQLTRLDSSIVSATAFICFYILGNIICDRFHFTSCPCANSGNMIVPSRMTRINVPILITFNVAMESSQRAFGQAYRGLRNIRMIF